MTRKILVVDDDRDIAGFVEADLVLEGYQVAVVHDGRAALASVLADPPDLVLLDVMMPHVDGVEVLRRIRSNPATASLPVLLLTAKTLLDDKVLGLTAGADDYIVKPFDTLELMARIRTTLRRTAEARAVSPLTGLPGNTRIDLEILTRAAAGAPYAVCHVDLDRFKSFNDAYGFLRGDALLMTLSRCLVSAAAAAGEPAPFLGHVGGDDFAVVCTPEQAEKLGAQVVADFDAAVGEHYDAADLARGYLEVVDRRMELRRHPLVSVSIGVAWGNVGDTDHHAVVAAAGEMKSYAKGRPGSLVAVDRRGAPACVAD